MSVELYTIICLHLWERKGGDSVHSIFEKVEKGQIMPRSRVPGHVSQVVLCGRKE